MCIRDRLSSRERGNVDHGRVSGVTSLHCAEDDGEIDLPDLEASSPVPDEIRELWWGRWESKKARNWMWCIATNGWIRFFAWYEIGEKRIYRVAKLPSGSPLWPSASGVNKQLFTLTQRLRWITAVSNYREGEKAVQKQIWREYRTTTASTYQRSNQRSRSTCRTWNRCQSQYKEADDEICRIPFMVARGVQCDGRMAMEIERARVQNRLHPLTVSVPESVPVAGNGDGRHGGERRGGWR